MPGEHSPVRQYASHPVCRPAKASDGGLWHPILMQFYSGPLMHLLSGVDTIAGSRSISALETCRKLHGLPFYAIARFHARQHVVRRRKNVYRASRRRPQRAKGLYQGQWASFRLDLTDIRRVSPGVAGYSALSCDPVKPVGPRAKIPTVTVPASGSHETRRWRKADLNRWSQLRG
jgi:hypothetical protein